MGDKEKVVSAKQYFTVEEAQTGEVLHLSSSIIRRNFWRKGNFFGFPYNLNQGVSKERIFW